MSNATGRKGLLSIILILCLMINMMAVMAVSVSAATLPEGGRAFSAGDNLSLVKDLQTQPKTYEALFYAPSDVNRAGVFFGNYYGTSTPCLNFEIHKDGQPDLYIIDGDGNKMTQKFDAVDVRTDSWTHLVITHEVGASGATLNCYINGELADTITTDLSFELDMAEIQEAYAFRLGGDSRSDNTQNFKGKIKNVALYSDVLTADEIKVSYESGVNTEDSALMAYYQLDNTDGATYIEDATANGYDLGVKPTTGGRTFDAEDDFSLEKDLAVQPKTYEAVIFAPSNVSRTGEIFGNFYSATTACVNFEIHDNGYPALYIIDQDGNKMTTKFEDVDVRKNAWLHLVITHETGESGATYKCYIDGELADTITSDLPFELDMEKVQFTHAFTLGRDSRAGNAQYFKGRIKNVALYSDVLTADEIKASYENGVNTENTDLMAYYQLDNTDNATSLADVTGNGYNLSPRFAPNKNPIASEDYDYSFAIIGDIQKIVYNDAYEGTNFIDNTFDWIVANKDAKKIKFAMGLGDITDKNGSDKTPNDGINQTNLEWQIAAAQHQKLTDAGIPYSLIQGNHDTVAKLDQFFAGNDNFANADAGYYSEDSLGNYYVRFTAGSQKYMVVCLQYGPTDEMVDWAGQVIAANPDHKVIITTHAYLAKTATTMDFFYTGNTIPRKPTDKSSVKNNGNQIWSELASQHENVIMVLSGHVPCGDIKMRQDAGVHGNTVTQFLIDPQGIDLDLDYKTALVAMFYFSNDGKDVEVEYISTYHSVQNGEDYLYNQSDNKFSFSIPVTTDPAAVECDYGTIPGYYSNEVTYPFVVFKSDKTFVGGYGELSQAIAAVKAAGDASDCTILMRKNAELRDATVDLSEFKATITLDLGGNTLIKGNDGSVFTLRAGNNASQGGKFAMENGTILKYGANPIVSVDYGTDLTNDYKTAFEFSDVTFVDKNGGENNIFASLESGYTTGNACVYPTAVFNDCTFDYLNSSSVVPMINLTNTDGCDRVVWDVEVNGGKIAASKAIIYSDFTRTDSTEGRADSLLFGKGKDGKYLSLQLPAGATAPDSGSIWPSGEDNMSFVESDGIYELQKINGYVTKYGIVPAGQGYEDKKILVFKNGSLYGGYDKFVQNESMTMKEYALYAAKCLTDGNNDGEVGSTVQLLFQDDVTMDAYYDKCNLGQVQGTIVFDLNGHKLIQNFDNALLFTRAYDWEGIKDATFEICNGEVVLKNGFLYFGANSYTATATKYKTFHLNFDNVKFTYAEGSAATSFLAKYSDHKSVTGGQKIGYDVNFTDCVFDLTNAASMTTVFNANDSDITTGNSVVNLNVNGCEIITGKPDITLYAEHESNGSTVTFNKNEDGKYLTMTVKGSTEAPTATANGGDLSFAKIAEAEGSITYQLGPKGMMTKYGFVPAESAEKKFLVFKNGSFIAGYDEFYTYKADALYKAKVEVDGNNDGEVGSTVQVLFMEDAELSSYGIGCNVGQIQGTMVLDLNGHTLTQAFSDDPFLFTRAHNWKGSEDGTIEICNGDVVLKTPLLYFGLYNTAKNFYLNFDNVDFSFAEGATTTAFLGQFKDTDANTSGKKIGYEISFTDCTVDLTNADSMATVFNAADDDTAKGNAIVKVNVNGCEIITEKPAATLYEEHATNGSFVTFNKNEDGKYLSMKVLGTEEAPTATANDGALEFMLTSKDTDSATYRLMSVKDATIALTTAPTKSTYHQDKDALDVTGGKITVTYEAGVTKVVDLTADMVSGFDNTKTGTQTLTITLNGKTTTFDITVEGHTAGNLIVDTAATCTDKGVGHKNCTVCDKLMESNVEIAVDPVAHKWENDYTVDTPETCGAEGVKSIHCEYCDITKTDSVTAIPATGNHTAGDLIVDTAATCTDKGVGHKDCTVCGLAAESNIEIPAKGHGETEVKDAKEPNCTESGYTGDTYCTVCDAKIADGETIPAKGHGETEYIVEIPATAEKEGLAYNKCTVCGNKVGEDIILPKTGVASIGGETFATLEEALDAATTGDVIKLNADVTVDYITVDPDVTLDLSGKTLTADYIIGFNGSAIYGEGKLIVDKDKVALDQTNGGYLPVHDGEGYIFIKVGFENRTTLVGEKTYAFSPLFDAKAHEALLKHYAVSGVRVVVRLSWAKEGNYTATQDFTYLDSMVDTVIESYDGANYGEMFVAEFAGSEAGKATDVTVSAVIVSDTGVEIASAVTEFQTGN